MTSSNDSRALFTALLGSILAGNSEMHQLDPSKPLDEQIEAIHAKQRAEHIKECPECQAELKAKEHAKQVDEFNERNAKQAAETLNKQDIASSKSRDRTLAGYMAFEEGPNGLKPIHESFDSDHDTVAEARDQFMDSPVIKIVKLMGQPVPNIVVLPVFAN